MWHTYNLDHTGFNSIENRVWEAIDECASQTFVNHREASGACRMC